MSLKFSQIAEVVGKNMAFTKSGMYWGVSFAVGCECYQTKYRSIYITDYDLKYDPESYSIMDSDNFTKNGLLTIFYKTKGYFNSMVFSASLLSDIDYMIKMIDDFKRETEIKINKA